MRNNNSRVNKRFGMNQEYSSERNSQGIEGKRKNERKGGNSDTNPSHDYPNSSPGFSDSKPIGKKAKLNDDSDQADVKNQQKSSENKDSEHEDFEFNPKASQKKKKRKMKGQDWDEESEEEEDQNDSGYRNHDHFDNSNPDYPESFAERDEKVEEEAEYVQQEDEHENVTPGPTNEQPNPSYDRDFDENPGSNKNPSNSTEDEPFVKQSESGHKSVPNSSKTKEGNGSKGQSNQKRAGNSNFNASDHFIPHEDQKGRKTPQVGINLIGYRQNKPMGIGLRRKSSSVNRDMFTTVYPQLWQTN